MKLSVSILNSKDKEADIRLLNDSKVTYFHLDVMDNKFVPNFSLPVSEISRLSKLANKELDVHLMVEDPMFYINQIKQITNIKYITIHLEIDKDIRFILSKIKSYGFKCGLSIKPKTSIEEIIPYLNDIDLVLLMTVEPGLGGQKFLTESKERLKNLKKLLENYDIKIEVDGGINDITKNDVKEADIAVVGSYITNSDNPINQINKLLV